MKPGDILTGDNGMRFVVGDLIAIQGREGCTDARCTRRNGQCIGYHCPTCGKSCGSQGHDCPEAKP